MAHFPANRCRLPHCSVITSRQSVTREQILTACEQGFVGIAVDTVKLVDSELAAAERARVVQSSLSALQDNRSIVIHSANGSVDARLIATANALGARRFDARYAAEILGRELGLILRSLLTKTKLRRVVVAGGDPSGFAVRELGIDALEMIAPVSPGAPLCRAYSFGDSSDTMEIALKGGQLGTNDYFERVRCGRAVSA